MAVDQARHVLALVEAMRNDDLDGLCTALEQAERLVGALEARIRQLVEQEDRAPCRAPERRAC